MAGTIDLQFPADIGETRDKIGLPPVYFGVPQNLRRWHVSLARLRSGTGRVRVLFIGDSKTMGAGAGDASSNSIYTVNAALRNKPSHFAKLLTAAGIPAVRSSVFGLAGLASIAELKEYDPRISGANTDWTSDAADGLGGRMLISGLNSDDLSFTPDGVVDTCEVYFAKDPNFDGQGQITLDASSTVIGTYSAGDPARSTAKTVATFAKGAHTIHTKRTANSYLAILGMVAYDSTVGAVDVISAGVSGSISEYHTSGFSPWSSANCIAVVAPDLVLIQLGSNDLNFAVPTSTIVANILDIVTKAKAAGASVVIEYPTVGFPGGYGSDAERDVLREAIVGIGASEGCVVIDHSARFSTWHQANGLGLMRDAIHETQLGYADEAQALFSALCV